MQPVARLSRVSLNDELQKFIRWHNMILKTCPKRYESECFLQAFKNAPIKMYESEAVVEFQVQGHEYEIYFPLIDGTVASESMNLAIDVLENLNILDNQVQESCADECKRTGIHPDNYDLYLACIFVDNKTAKPTYYGTKINTEWDAEFEKVGASWRGINF